MSGGCNMPVRGMHINNNILCNRIVIVLCRTLSRPIPIPHHTWSVQEVSNCALGWDYACLCFNTSLIKDQRDHGPIHLAWVHGSATGRILAHMQATKIIRHLRDWQWELLNAQRTAEALTNML